jgi:hypothetical protein
MELGTTERYGSNRRRRLSVLREVATDRGAPTLTGLVQPSLLYCTRRHAAALHNNRFSAVTFSACVRRLVHDCNMAQAEEESADRYAELAKHACCKTLNFGYFVVKKPISKRTAMHSTRPLTAAKRLKAAELKETTAPIAVRDMTVGMPPLLQPWHVCARCPWHVGSRPHGTWALDAHGMRRWLVW